MADGASMVRTIELPSCLLPRIVPTPSTWPATRWPPSLSFNFIARSRLTGAPADTCPKAVHDAGGQNREFRAGQRLIDGRHGAHLFDNPGKHQSFLITCLTR